MFIDHDSSDVQTSMLLWKGLTRTTQGRCTQVWEHHAAAVIYYNIGIMNRMKITHVFVINPSSVKLHQGHSITAPLYLPK